MNEKSTCKFCKYAIEFDIIHGWCIRQWNGSELVYCYRNPEGKRHAPLKRTLNVLV